MEGRELMGTASFGIHGSGSGMRAGGGGEGGYYSFGGRMDAYPYDNDTIKKEVGSQFQELFARAIPYLKSMFTNKYLINTYFELFDILALLKGEQPVKKIGEKYNIDMNEPGFILDLIDKLDRKYRSDEVVSIASEAVRLTLEKVLFKAVNDDSILSIDGSGVEVVEAMRLNSTFWHRLSGHFLSELAIIVFKKDTESKTPQASIATAKEIERRTNKVIEKFKEMSGDKKTDYSSLLKYIENHWDWFKEEMTNE